MNEAPLEPRRVFLTGATGFIGRALVRSLIEDGISVAAVSRHPSRGGDLLGPEVQVLPWEGGSFPWQEALDGAWAVVNLAGESLAEGRWTRRKKERIRDSRIQAGRALVKAVAAAGKKPAVLVQASGVGIYGDTGKAEIDEEASPGNGFLGPLAVEWEASTCPVEDQGIRRVILRTGVVLGTEGGALPRMLPPFRYFLGGPLGSGRQGFPWIHLADAIGAIRFLLAREDLSGPFHLTAPQMVDNRAFSKALGRALGRPSFLKVPGLALRLLFGQMAREVLLSGQKAKPSRLMEGGFPFSFPDLESALQDLLGT